MSRLKINYGADVVNKANEMADNNNGGTLPQMTESDLRDEKNMDPNRLSSGRLQAGDVKPSSIVNQQGTPRLAKPASTANRPWGAGDGAFYDWWGKHLEEYRPETDEERGKRERREKRERLMAAIGDGLGAMSDAYNRARGLQPATDGVSLTGKLRERYEKEKADREARADRYYTGWYNLNKMQQADEAYDYAKSQRPLQEELQKEQIEAYKRKDNGSYGKVGAKERILRGLAEDLNDGLITQDEFNEKVNTLAKVFSGRNGATYSRTTSPKGTTDRVSSTNPNDLQPTVSAPPASTNSGRRSSSGRRRSSGSRSSRSNGGSSGGNSSGNRMPRSNGGSSGNRMPR